MLKVAIVGASGYTGVELIRLLSNHPEVEITAVTSEQSAGKKISSVFPSLTNIFDKTLEPLDADLIAKKADLIFTALPHQKAMEVVPHFLKAGKKVIDLSADFRIKDASVFEAWYGVHKAPEYLKEAVYGLPELHREEIKKSQLVANPGCYPTSAILALAPVMRNYIDLSTIIIDSKSGVSGAGRSVTQDTHFPEANEGFKAYKVGSHRHTPEIEQELGIMAGRRTPVTFTQHLLPVERGILTTAYVWLKTPPGPGGIQELYDTFYTDEPFVRVMPAGSFPDICQVRCSNFCDIGLWYDAKENKAIIVSAIDNLVKGASGQAVHNMNLIYGLEETIALLTPPTSI